LKDGGEGGETQLLKRAIALLSGAS
jgi:hypothetical protein